MRIGNCTQKEKNHQPVTFFIINNISAGLLNNFWFYSFLTWHSSNHNLSFQTWFKWSESLIKLMTKNELTKSWLNTDLKVTYGISRKQINTSPPTPKKRDLVNFRRLETSDYIFWIAFFFETKSVPLAIKLLLLFNSFWQGP